MSGQRDTIFVVTHEFYPKTGGVSIFVQEVADAAMRLGHAVTVIAPQPAQQLADSVGYSVVSYSRTWWRSAIAYELFKRRHQLEHATLYLPQQRALRVMLYLQLLRVISPKNIVITLHGTEIFSLHASRRHRYLFDLLLKKASKITVLSHYCRQILQDRFAIDVNKVKVIPGAVRSVLPTAETRRPANPSNIVVLTVARIHPRKGQLAVMQGIAALPEGLREVITYKIVGASVDEAYRKTLTNFSANHGIRCEFVGEIHDGNLTAIYQDADIIAMTSVEHESRRGFFGIGSYERSVEGFGLSYLEAAAMGLPVLAYRTGGVEEAVRDGDTGILVAENDIDALAKALARLIREPDLRQRLGENGQKWAGRFSWDETAKAIFANDNP